MIDLHSHTTASDGQHTPDELFALAHEAGVRALAVTDHDTVAALEQCERAAAREGIELVPGIEISALLNRREIHVLGHFVDRSEPNLKGFSERLRAERERRMEMMVDKMRSLGFPVTMDQVRALASEAHLARPHLARVLVEQGWCLSVQEAFDRFLADGRPAHVERYLVPAEEAIALIREAGGAATVAHPAISKVEGFELEALKRVGLVGLEVLHSDHPPSQREKYLELSRALDLVPTGGSDFHGEKVAPGRKLGTVDTGAEAFERLRARAGR